MLTYVAWNIVDKRIREGFYILDMKLSDVGFVTEQGNIMVKVEAIKFVKEHLELE